jgi:hypothetical protein
MSISELLNLELNLNWLRRRFPQRGERFDEFLDITHFTLIVNGAILFVAFILSPDTWLDCPDLSTFATYLLAISIPVWCLTYGIWYWRVIRGRRRHSVEVEPTDLWDEWLDGPV